MNPYQAPSLPRNPQICDSSITRRSWVRAATRWTLVCGISAAPSFYFGFGINNFASRVPAMLCGIAVFIVAYTIVDVLYLGRHVAASQRLRRTVYFGYGLRLFMSIVFPIGIIVDMICGMLSVSFVQNILGLEVGHGLTNGQNQVISSLPFLSVFITTIVQGCILNCIVLGTMGIAYTVMAMWGGVRVATARSSADSSEPDALAGATPIMEREANVAT